MNILENALPQQVHSLGQRTVLFAFSLREYPELHDGAAVQQAMEDYAAMYTRVEHWEAHSNGVVLTIEVTGEINELGLKAYRTH